MGSKIIFLGTGTSTGVPALLCGCEVCRSTNPKDKRLRTSALVEINGLNLLIDPGPDFRYQALRTGIKHIDAVLITHSHYDHVGGIDDLRPYCHTMTTKMPIYCTADVAQDLHNRVPYCFATHPYPGVPTFNIHVINHEPFYIQNVKITPLPVMHHKEIMGYKIGDDLAYITDAKHVPASTVEKIRGIKVLVLNALRLREHHTHMNLSQALEVIAQVNPQQACLIHMADAIGLHDKVNASLPTGVELAYDTHEVEF